MQNTAIETVPMPAMPEWREVGWCDSRYVSSLGKILGGVEKGHRTWRAWYEGKSLGEYIDEQSAKDAVRRAYTHPLDSMP